MDNLVTARHSPKMYLSALTLGFDIKTIVSFRTICLLYFFRGGLLKEYVLLEIEMFNSLPSVNTHSISTIIVYLP